MFLQRRVRRELSDADTGDIVAFLESLTGELRHRPDIRLTRPIRQAADRHVRFHLFAQCAHDKLLYQHGKIPESSLTQAISAILEEAMGRVRRVIGALCEE